MSRPARILTAGSANIDLVVRAERLPRRGETIMGGDLEKFFGGKGANQAIAAKRLGGEVEFAGMVGEDPHGTEYRERLRAEGIAIDCLYTTSHAPTGSATIIVDGKGDNMIVVSPGANRFATPGNMPGLDEAIDRADVVLLQLEIPLETVAYIQKQACEKGKLVILNPSPLPANPADILASIRVDYLVVNEHELAVLSGVEAAGDANVMEAARGIAGKYAESLVVTRGAEPTLFFCHTGQEYVPCAPVEPVDTVGAGDTFAGALAVGLSEGMTPGAAVHFANIAAAQSTLKRGAQISMPRREELPAV